MSCVAPVQKLTHAEVLSGDGLAAAMLLLLEQKTTLEGKIFFDVEENKLLTVVLVDRDASNFVDKKTKRSTTMTICWLIDPNCNEVKQDNNYILKECMMGNKDMIWKYCEPLLPVSFDVDKMTIPLRDGSHENIGFPLMLPSSADDESAEDDNSSGNPMLSKKRTRKLCSNAAKDANVLINLNKLTIVSQVGKYLDNAFRHEHAKSMDMKDYVMRILNEVDYSKRSVGFGIVDVMHSLEEEFLFLDVRTKTTKDTLISFVEYMMSTQN